MKREDSSWGVSHPLITFVHSTQYNTMPPSHSPPPPLSPDSSGIGLWKLMPQVEMSYFLLYLFPPEKKEEKRYFCILCQTNSLALCQMFLSITPQYAKHTIHTYHTSSLPVVDPSKDKRTKTDIDPKYKTQNRIIRKSRCKAYQ